MLNQVVKLTPHAGDHLKSFMMLIMQYYTVAVRLRLDVKTDSIKPAPYVSLHFTSP